MFKKILLVMFLIFFASCSQSSGINKTHQKIVVFGDSLVAGYGIKADEAFPARLEYYLKEKGHDVKVMNEGLRGDTARAARFRVQNVLDHNPDIVILEFGVNDVFRRHSPEEIKSSLNYLVREFMKNDIEVVIAGMRVPGVYGPDYERQFQQIYVDVAKKHNLVLYPFFLDGIVPMSYMTLEDGAHPSPTGVNMIVRRFLPTFEIALD